MIGPVSGAGTSGRRPRLLVAWAMVWAAIASGCSGGSRDEARATDDPCQLFSPAEALAHLNVPPGVKGGRMQPIGETQPVEPAVGTATFCSFSYRDDEVAEYPSPALYVGLASIGPNVAKALFEDWRKETKAARVRGLGAPAVAGGAVLSKDRPGPVLLVLAGDRVLIVAIPGPTIDGRAVTDDATRLERERRLAHMALDRGLRSVQS